MYRRNQHTDQGGLSTVCTGEEIITRPLPKVSIVFAAAEVSFDLLFSGLRFIAALGGSRFTNAFEAPQ